MSTPVNRADLAELLAEYGDSLDSFDRLRPDSYEHSLAAAPGGLDFLRSFYSEIMRPGQTQMEAAAKCPTWPLGCKRERQRPSARVVNEVSERLRTTAALARVSPVGKFLTELRRELKATPLGDNQAILDAVCGSVGGKLLSDIRAGGGVDVKLMARLQEQRVIEQNEKRLEQNDKKIANDARRIAILEAREAKTKSVVADTTLTAEEKEAAVKQIFGLS